MTEMMTWTFLDRELPSQEKMRYHNVNNYDLVRSELPEGIFRVSKMKHVKFSNCQRILSPYIRSCALKVSFFLTVYQSF